MPRVGLEPWQRPACPRSSAPGADPSKIPGPGAAWERAGERPQRRCTAPLGSLAAGFRNRSGSDSPPSPGSSPTPLQPAAPRLPRGRGKGRGGGLWITCVDAGSGEGCAGSAERPDNSSWRRLVGRGTVVTELRAWRACAEPRPGLRVRPGLCTPDAARVLSPPLPGRW